MQQENKETIQLQLNEIWQELLGLVPEDPWASATPETEVIPTLESDPWSALLHERGTEVVDLEQLRLHVSEQDVEQALRWMQEQPGQDPE